jgi:hypothetical protein
LKSRPINKFLILHRADAGPVHVMRAFSSLQMRSAIEHVFRVTTA